MKLIHFCVACYGIYAVAYAARSGLYFARIGYPLFKAISLSELCQAFLGGVTVLFNLLALFGFLPNTPQIIQAVMRLVMFYMMVRTSRRVRRESEPVTETMKEAEDALD